MTLQRDTTKQWFLKQTTHRRCIVVYIDIEQNALASRHLSLVLLVTFCCFACVHVFSYTAQCWTLSAPLDRMFLLNSREGDILIFFSRRCHHPLGLREKQRWLIYGHLVTSPSNVLWWILKQSCDVIIMIVIISYWVKTEIYIKRETHYVQIKQDSLLSSSFHCCYDNPLIHIDYKQSSVMNQGMIVLLCCM